MALALDGPQLERHARQARSACAAGIIFEFGCRAARASASRSSRASMGRNRDSPPKRVWNSRGASAVMRPWIQLRHVTISGSCFYDNRSYARRDQKRSTVMMSTDAGEETIPPGATSPEYTIRKSIALNAVGHLCGETEKGATIRVAVAQLNVAGSADRKMLRNLQSRAARGLLADTLQKSRPEQRGMPWLLKKTKQGQPYLDGDALSRVSLAHSNHWVACTVAASRFVGVDVEQIKNRDWAECSELALHPTEVPWVLAGSTRETNIRGLICWCRKEALVKAMGLGLDPALPFSEIGFCPKGKLLALPARFGAASDWTSYCEVVCGEAVVAAVWH